MLNRKSKLIYAILFSNLPICCFAWGGDYILDGPYIGAGVAYNAVRFQEKLDISIPPIITLRHTGDHIGREIGGEILAGFGKFLNQFYLGAELSAHFTSAKDLSYLDHFQGGITLNANETRSFKNSYSISLLPGIKLNNSTLGYGRVGYTNGKFEVNNVSTITGDGLPPMSMPHSHKERLDGITYGVGIETALVGNINLQLEARQTRFDSFTPAEGEKLKPYANQVLAKLVYRFGESPIIVNGNMK
ncbi:outer membrane protein [Legionella sp. CNM-1927-20]|uniref:outer membrane protein n=1 Tax=Legionella sp. CNM-1927-20 TaxID=3422221 RepID=UPI00403B1D2D